MNPYATPPFLAAILNGVLIIWAAAHAERGVVRRTFIAWNICLALWNIGIAVGYCISDPDLAQVWYKWVSSCVIAGISPFFLHFVMAVTGTPDTRINRWILRLGYASIVCFAWMGIFTDLLMDGVHHYYWGYYPVAGRGEWMFGLTLYSLAGYAFWLLTRELRQATGHHRNQIKYLLAGAAFVFGCGFSNFLPLHGVPIYPMGNLMNSIYSLLVAYAILEHGLMDMRVILRRGTVYAMLSGGLTAVYLSLVAVLQRLFGHYGLQENYVFYTAAFPITVILAPTMKTRIEPWVDRTFFGKATMDPESALKNQEIAFMGVLATEMAHELAKPLTHIMNEGSRLEQTIKGPARESLIKIGKAVQQATEILDGFVLLAPDRSLHRIAVPLNELLEEALTTLGLGHYHAVKIVRQFDEMPPVLVNPGQLVQVFTNLIQNAWQAMPEGGTLLLALRKLTPPSRLPIVEIVIEDSGSGIPPELQSRVFEPFFTTKQAQGGRGVGLTLSRAMVERHGGTICIQSPTQTEQGTRMVIRLPVRPQEGPNETA